MTSYPAHVYRNLNYIRILDYIPTYEQLKDKPTKVKIGPFVWTRLLAIFDLFHSPTSTVKYMAIDPLNLHSTFEVLADHKRKNVTMGSYNYCDFRIHLLFHILIDVVTFLLWGRVLFEHSTVEEIRQAISRPSEKNDMHVMYMTSNDDDDDADHADRAQKQRNLNGRSKFAKAVSGEDDPCMPNQGPFMTILDPGCRKLLWQ